MEDFISKKEILFDTIWSNIVSEELSNTINYFKKHLVIIDSVQIRDFFSVIYGVTNEKSKVAYYKGDSPVDSGMSDNLGNGFIKLPKTVQTFYTSLHNGFYYLATASMGLVPLQSVTRLADEEWGILDEIPKPLPVNIERSYSFFTNGMGGYVIIDVSKDKKMLHYGGLQKNQKLI